LTRRSRDWYAISEFRFHYFVGFDGAYKLASKIRVTLENCRLEGAYFWVARKMRRPGKAGCAARPTARPTGDGCIPLHGCQVFFTRSREQHAKSSQFRRPMFTSKLFKSSPNAVVSMTGLTAATASRLPSSCQSTHSLLAFVQRKTAYTYPLEALLGCPEMRCGANSASVASRPTDRLRIRWVSILLQRTYNTSWSREEVNATKLVHKFRAATLECNAGQCGIELLLTLFHTSYIRCVK